MEKKESGKGYLKKLFEKRETMLALIVIVLFVVLSITNSNFLKWSHLKVIISSLSVDGIIVIGMTIRKRPASSWPLRPS